MNSHDPYAALKLKDYRRYFIGNLIVYFGVHMQTTAVGWDIYTRTNSELALGLAGLAQFFPVILLFLVSGHVADRFNRKWIVTFAVALIAIASMGLALISYYELDTRLIYVCLFMIGVARTFQQPARAALLPLIVPQKQFNNAVTWNSSGFHLASVLGPAAGGFCIKWFNGPTFVYVIDVFAALTFACMLSTIRLHRKQVMQSQNNLSFKELAAGFHFIRRQQVVLGALLLDLFAVLLGGAVTLLPVYAEGILKTGPEGLGWMRAAPAVGALIMAFIIAHRPPMRRTGIVLLWSVVGFGVATIVFGLSKIFWLSLLMLFLTGAFDNVSVVIRHTLVQTLTPDELRGRVSAVNSMFIGASNELGGFESGIVAHWFGPVFSVVSGGIGTIAVVAITAISLPKLRRQDRLEQDAAE